MRSCNLSSNRCCSRLVELSGRLIYYVTLPAFIININLSSALTLINFIGLIIQSLEIGRTLSDLAYQSKLEKAALDVLISFADESKMLQRSVREALVYALSMVDIDEALPSLNADERREVAGLNQLLNLRIECHRVNVRDESILMADFNEQQQQEVIAYIQTREAVPRHQWFSRVILKRLYAKRWDPTQRGFRIVRVA